jgi:hypothetical protein
MAPRSLHDNNPRLRPRLFVMPAAGPDDRPQRCRGDPELAGLLLDHAPTGVPVEDLGNLRVRDAAGTALGAGAVVLGLHQHIRVLQRTPAGCRRRRNSHAENASVAVLAVLGRTLGETGASALKALLDSARLPSLRIAALGSPFDSKDALKARGYRWHAEAKGWVGEIAAAGKEEELEWLKKTVYEGKNVEVEIETLTAKQRYAERSGKNERMRI